MMIEAMSPEDTIAFGLALGHILRAGDVVCLSGDLGAGKTYLTKGIGRGMGVETEITSPTYTIMQVYDADVPLYHFDLYRIERPEDLLEIGFEEYVYGRGICVIEWADKFPGVIPEAYLSIQLKYTGDQGIGRRIELSAVGERYRQRLEELKNHVCTRD